MFQLFKYGLLFLWVVLSINSCRDKDPTKPGYQRKPPMKEFYTFRMTEVKDYVWFKPGTYWIYKNTKNNLLDTVTCTSFYYDSVTIKGTYDYSKHITLNYDRLEITSYSSHYKWTYRDWSGNTTPDDKYFKNNRFVMERTCPSGLLIPFFYPFDIKGYSGTGSSSTQLISVEEVINMQNKTFNKVAVFDIDSDDIWHHDTTSQIIRYPRTKYYWAQNVGLIKRENVSENYSWELIDYNIVK